MDSLDIVLCSWVLDRYEVEALRAFQFRVLRLFRGQ